MLPLTSTAQANGLTTLHAGPFTYPAQYTALRDAFAIALERNGDQNVLVTSPDGQKQNLEIWIRPAKPSREKDAIPGALEIRPGKPDRRRNKDAIPATLEKLLAALRQTGHPATAAQIAAHLGMKAKHLHHAAQHGLRRRLLTIQPAQPLRVRLNPDAPAATRRRHPDTVHSRLLRLLETHPDGLALTEAAHHLGLSIQSLHSPIYTIRRSAAPIRILITPYRPQTYALANPPTIP